MFGNVLRARWKENVMLTPLRAVIHDGKIEPTDPVDLPEGTRVLVTLTPDEEREDAEKQSPSPRRLGTLSGTVQYLSPDFDAPLDDFQDHMA